MIIGFAGKKYSGKTTAAQHIVDNYEYCLVGFADKLKEIAKDLWGLSEKQVNGSVEDKETIDPKWGVSPRFIMQTLGAEVARQIHPDTWVSYVIDVTLHDLKILGHNKITIADVRYPNEAKAIHKAGGLVVLIKRKDLEDDGDNHSSETGLPDKLVDIIIENDGTLADFYNRISYFMNELENGFLEFAFNARARRNAKI